MINILCYKLPAAVSQPMHQEYEKKWAEIERIIAKPGNNYEVLVGYESTVQCLLALSLFYRNVFGYIQSASEFYVAINKDNGKEIEHTVRIGDSVFNKEEQNKILGATITFDRILRRFQIPSSFFEFSETLQFVRNCRSLFLTPEYEYEEDDTI